MSEEKIKIADDTMKLFESKLSTPDVKEVLEGWGKSIAVFFKDIQTGYVLKFAMDGSVTIERKSASEIQAGTFDAVADVAEATDFKDALEGTTSPMGLLTSGKLKIKGNQGAFMKLAPALL